MFNTVLAPSHLGQQQSAARSLLPVSAAHGHESFSPGDQPASCRAASSVLVSCQVLCIPVSVCQIPITVLPFIGSRFLTLLRPCSARRGVVRQNACLYLYSHKRYNRLYLYHHIQCHRTIRFQTKTCFMLPRLGDTDFLNDQQCRHCIINTNDSIDTGGLPVYVAGGGVDGTF